MKYNLSFVRDSLLNRLQAWLVGKKIYRIEVEWCDEDEVFIASSPDIDGLILEAETADEMMKYLQDVVPMMLEEYGLVEKNKANKNVVKAHVEGNAQVLALCERAA